MEVEAVLVLDVLVETVVVVVVVAVVLVPVLHVFPCLTALGEHG